MAIDFSRQRWEKTRETYAAWWRGDLGRPIFPVVLSGREVDRAVPEAPLLSQATCTDLSIPAEAVIDRIDYELSGKVYLGDAFPWFSFGCFGPGVAAAFLGADIENSTGNVWFIAKEECPIADLHFEYDPDNKWLGRIRALLEAGMARWQGQVLMGMADLGGTLDILSTFRPGERLLLDILTEPDEVNRLVWELHDLWRRFFEELDGVCRAGSPGYAAWDGLFSDQPFYMLQCDIAYMMGPDMVADFVLPELAATCKWLSRSFYHLDGTGQLPHVNHLLNIDDLHGIQWVAGAQEAGRGHEPWLDLYRRIHDAGKKIELVGFNGFDELNRVIEAIDGDAGTLAQFCVEDTVERVGYYEQNLPKWGIPVS